MYDGQKSTYQEVGRDRVMSRIEQDVEHVKNLTTRIRAAREMNVANARALGYFESPSTGPSVGVAPQPVITTMSDAIHELERAVDELHGSFNLFQ